MITREGMGTLPGGAEVWRYTLRNAAGAYVEISTLGGCILRIVVPDKEGVPGDVTLGYDTLQTMRAGSGYMGFLIGRYANRIGGASFELNGKTYALAKNNGENHLHGGIHGFDKKVWSPEIQGEALRLFMVSEDGEEGYPGRLEVTVRYTFTEEATLRIEYEAVADADTVLNLTNHVYFNLSGPLCRDLQGHSIQIQADAFTEVSSGACIPTGRIAPVEGTALDLRTPTDILEGLARQASDQQMQFGNGFDHNYVLRGWDGALRQAAVVTHAGNGRRLEAWTDQPGVQFYSGNSIAGETPGKGGVPYGFRQGFCLETQHYPDSVHHANFPSCVLKKGDTFRSVTEYRFSA